MQKDPDLAHDGSPEGVVYVPAPPDTHRYTDLGSIEVDGETFVVRTREDDGVVLYDWVSGPNEGYGFSVSGGAASISRERHEAAIRDFLSGIDPKTGYLAYP